ncbi:MAG: SMI1/KNR4 family protein [Gemmataceae bacterium]|nr:SMI1/KNR4 family protein [Gemmataceae bacterium]
MERDDWNGLIDRLRSRGIMFDPGLTDAEVVAAESRYGFRFPPDLRAFLQTALPHGGEFPDWRSGSEGGLRYWFDLPRRGVVFDIEHNGFWLDEWGPRPAALADAVRTAEQLVATAPRLIPVYLHRMMPAEPHLPGNPVFSVHQTDIIVYGADLRDYLAHEFLMSGDEKEEWRVPDGARPIRFWNLDRFQAVRWGPDGSCVFDNSSGTLP